MKDKCEKEYKEIKNRIQKFPAVATEPNLICENYNVNKEYPLNYKWNLDLYGPKGIVDSYSNIWIKDDYRIVGYHYSALLYYNHGILEVVSEDINVSPKYKHLPKSIVMAIPKDIKLPVVIESIEDSSIYKYRETNFMLAIDGDKTPLSYLQAAMVYEKVKNQYADSERYPVHITLPLSDKDYMYYENNGSNILNYDWNMIDREAEIIEPHFYYNENQEPVVVVNDINTGMPNFYGPSFNENKYIFHKETYNLEYTNRVLGTMPMELWL